MGGFVGLCLLIDFPDVPGTIPQQEVSNFCNQPGYSGFGNHGYVYSYFLDNSGGRMRYTNRVTPITRRGRRLDDVQGAVGGTQGVPGAA